MADADNLDNLSNAELRARMLAQGLPNIPVTDSSRKVLVKRLRASLGGNATLPSASPKKSGRELMTQEHIAAAVAAAAAPQLDKPFKSRRTIAGNPSDTKEDERRRQMQPVNKPQTVPEAIAVVKPVPAKGASIQSRRLSSSERREQPKQQIVRKPEPIVEEPTVPKKIESEKPLLVNSLIVLESDEEEDEQLAQAVQDAEDQYSEHKKQISSKPKPKAKLTATSVNTHEYVTKPLYPSLQSNTAEQQRLKQIYEHAPSPTQPRATLAASSSSSNSNTYDYRAATGRYSSYVSSPAQSYTSASSTLGYSSTLRRSPPRIFSNEFSDDTADEDVQGVKFESDFARNLARMRSERLGDRTASYRRSVNPGSSITGARRSLRQEQQSSSTAFLRLWQTLDNKYNLKSKLFILIVLLVLFAVYRFFY